MTDARDRLGVLYETRDATVDAGTIVLTRRGVMTPGWMRWVAWVFVSLGVSVYSTVPGAWIILVLGGLMLLSVLTAQNRFGPLSGAPISNWNRIFRIDSVGDGGYRDNRGSVLIADERTIPASEVQGIRLAHHVSRSSNGPEHYWVPFIIARDEAIEVAIFDSEEEATRLLARLRALLPHLVDDGGSPVSMDFFPAYGSGCSGAWLYLVPLAAVIAMNTIPWAPLARGLPIVSGLLLWTLERSAPPVRGPVNYYSHAARVRRFAEELGVTRDKLSHHHATGRSESP